MPRARIRSVELAWSEAGSGRAVLFLHGFPFSRRLWEPQLAALPPGWRGIAPDLRGFGESGSSPDPAYTMEQHAADALALLDHLQIEQAVVCGLSMGGYIALALQRAAPGRVRGLVLADTRAEPDAPEARAQRAAQAAAIERSGPGEFTGGMLPKLLAEDATPEVRAMVGAMMEGTSASTLIRALHGLAERPDARPGLAGIRVPVLVIGGTLDRITPPETLRTLQQGIGGAGLVLLEGVGHVSNLEAPAAFNRELGAFLSALEGAPPEPPAG